MSLSLLLDLYEVTMAAGYVRHGVHEQTAVFDLYFRHTPFGSGYAVFAGLEPALEHLETLRFDAGQIDYLRGLNLFDEIFLDYLRGFQFTGRVTAVPEGEVVFADEPLLTVEGGLAEAQLVETALLNLINFQTLIATKAARMVQAAGESTVVEFGARRAPGPDGALGATRAACVGGARTTSHLRAARRFGLQPTGTQAHSWVMAFPTELEAFRAYAEVFPDTTVLLIDTYDTLDSGLPNAITVAQELRARDQELRGVRLDSGDLASLSAEARRRLDAAGFPDVKIIASNELDEHAIAGIRGAGGRVDAFGVGTRLASPSAERDGAPCGVYKLVELEGEPRMKVSSDPGKSTIPGRKSLWRVVGKDGLFAADVIGVAPDVPKPGDPVHVPSDGSDAWRVPLTARLQDLRAVTMEAGSRTRPSPSLTSLADRAAERLSRLPEAYRRLEEPDDYRVGLTQELEGLRDKMIADHRGGGSS